MERDKKGKKGKKSGKKKKKKKKSGKKKGKKGKKEKDLTPDRLAAVCQALSRSMATSMSMARID